MNNACITGLSPSGHCGAAACCSEPYGCCVQCPDPCNSQCGWLDEDRPGEEESHETDRFGCAGSAVSCNKDY